MYDVSGHTGIHFKAALEKYTKIDKQNLTIVG